uniref:Uncharacterized protein n=1 Tax=Fusarium oxysporum (strain Fo5176) TaxID=660025 RepID=A0A0D2Y384_FUSOF
MFRLLSEGLEQIGKKLPLSLPFELVIVCDYHVLMVLSNPDNNSGCSLVDISHKLNLGAAFFFIFLVDAELVDPQPPRSSTSQTTECHLKLRGSKEGHLYAVTVIISS